jgi:hypothetical protein
MFLCQRMMVDTRADAQLLVRKRQLWVVFKLTYYCRQSNSDLQLLIAYSVFFSRRRFVPPAHIRAGAVAPMVGAPFRDKVSD